MCGRYGLGFTAQQLEDELDAEFVDADRWRPTYSFVRGFSAPALTSAGGDSNGAARELSLTPWGIKGAVFQKPEVMSINARADSVFRVQRWRELYRGGHTALVPMSGYVEFVEPRPKFKVPVFIHDDGAPLLTAAGLVDPEEGFVIMTMDASLAAGEVHTRQPIFIPEDLRQDFLTIGAGPTPGKGEKDPWKELLAALQDFSRTETERLQFHAISRDYNSPAKLGGRLSDPELIAPDPEMQHIIDTEHYEPALSPKERAAAKKAKS
jgi:putative SOS response-associated peptidase YedK